VRQICADLDQILVIHHDILNNLCRSGLLEHPRHNTQNKTTHLFIFIEVKAKIEKHLVNRKYFIFQRPELL